MILSFDLGTGGAKICVFHDDGSLHSKTFKSYSTQYPAPGFHVQNPDDWFAAVRDGANELAGKSPGLKNDIRAISSSGHSLAVVPVDDKGKLLFHEIPIWSDTRAAEQCRQFFETIDKTQWYIETGNGFTPECYSIFKIMWFRDSYPDLFKETSSILGSKDYINMILTGNIATDYSYASGSGVYNLLERKYDSRFLDAAGIDSALLPQPGRSDAYVGRLVPSAADALGLSGDVSVYCGGVDNSCMALGARNTSEGRAYLSLGSSAWIAVSSANPLIDTTVKPFIFDHVIPGMYTSATSIFSAGSSLKWFKDNLAQGLILEAKEQKRDIYDMITEKAAVSVIGANGVLFNPTLAGAPAASRYSNITGAFLNLRLGSNFNDLCRAVLEGITFELSAMYEKLNELCELSDEVVIVGGGSRSAFWRQMFADIFGCRFSRISTDQDAAALGAAALAAVGSGLWSDYSAIESVITEVESVEPGGEALIGYRLAGAKYRQTWQMLSEIGDVLK